MKRHRTLSIATFAITVFVVAGMSVTAWSKGSKQRKLVAHPAAGLKWEPFFPGGPMEAFVIGDKTGPGPVAFFIKFDAGFDSGWHTHDSDYTGIVLAGTLIETSKGTGDPVTLPVGSYYMQPGKPVVHRTECSKAEPCMVYIYEDGGFSFNPTTEDGDPAKPGDPRTMQKRSIGKAKKTSAK